MTVTPCPLHLVGRLARKQKPGRKPRAEQVKALLAHPSMSVLFCVIPTFANIDSCAVIAGLDPAIHLFEAKNVFAMDARVKPGHDESGVVKVGIS